MESWRLIWRDGIVPQLSTGGLEALAVALRDDDPRLRQGMTTSPPPLMCVQDFPCAGADAIGYAGWKGDGLTTVGEVEEHFARVCSQCDQATGGPADCRHFLNWYDDTPRPEMRRELAAEVRLAITKRYGDMIPDGFRKRMAETPQDALLFGALADYLDEIGQPDMAWVMRSHATALNMGVPL